MARNAVQFQKGLSMAEFSALRERGSVPRRARCDALAGRFRVSEVRRPVQLSRVQAAFPVLGLPRADVGAGRHDLPQVAHAADQMVPGDAPADGLEERHCKPRIGAPARRQMGHRLADQAEADGGHAPAELDLQARRRYPDRRCLSGRRKDRKTRAWSGEQAPFRHAVADP